MRVLFGLPVCVFAVIGALTGPARAQHFADTFNITIAEKTPDHPYYNEGFHLGYVVNGEQSPTITLVRDSLYLWVHEDITLPYPQDFYTIPIGGSGNFYDEIVDNVMVSKARWELRASDETPDTLYYASTREPWMGGTILIVDSVTSDVENSRRQEGRARHGVLSGAALMPNRVRDDPAVLSYSLSDRSDVVVEVVDPTGRVVRTIDVGTVASGRQEVAMPCDALTGGMYFWRISAVSENGVSDAVGRMHVVR